MSELQAGTVGLSYRKPEPGGSVASAVAPSPLRRRRAILGLWRAREAATAVEMAFLLPVFVMFLLGICEFGRAIWTQTALQFAVEAAARCAAVSPSLCKASGGSTMDVPGYAATQTYGMAIPKSAFTYTANATCGVASGSSGTGGAQVTASYRFNPVLSNLVPLNVTLSAKSCHP